MSNHPLPKAEDECPDWVKGLADAALTSGTEQFWDALAGSVSAILENHGIVVFRYSGGNEPALVFSNFNSRVSRGDFREYRTRAYLLDPTYLAFQKRLPGGIHLLRKLAADRFFHSEFYRTYYVQTGMSDELCIFCWIGHDDLIVISALRSKKISAFSASGVRFLRQINTLISSLVCRHVALGPSTQSPASSVSAVEPTLNIGGEGILTQRELAIANLILRGNSSPSMSLLLGISIETVKVHRRHIYRKLNISSQAELFALAMNRTADAESR